LNVCADKHITKGMRAWCTMNLPHLASVRHAPIMIKLRNDDWCLNVQSTLDTKDHPSQDPLMTGIILTRSLGCLQRQLWWERCHCSSTFAHEIYPVCFPTPHSVAQIWVLQNSRSWLAQNVQASRRGSRYCQKQSQLITISTTIFKKTHTWAMYTVRVAETVERANSFSVPFECKLALNEKPNGRLFIVCVQAGTEWKTKW